MRAAFLALVIALASPALAAEAPHPLPSPAYDPAPEKPGLQKITVAGGCFWGVQAVFQHVPGVERAVSGYAGGEAATAHYEVVSEGHSGHAESVEITYDPARVSLGALLRVHFSVVHDPTQSNRQGPDVGPQYRSAIFVSDDAQKRVVAEYLAQLAAAKAFDAPIVTRVEPLKGFYPAETYHQDYLVHHPDSPYIRYNDLPKVAALKQLMPALYREQPKLVHE